MSICVEIVRLRCQFSVKEHETIIPRHNIAMVIKNRFHGDIFKVNFYRF